MKRVFYFVCFAAMSACLSIALRAADSGDPGWPREFKQGNQKVVVHQPQIDAWTGYTNLHYRAAIAVTTGSGKKPIYGVTEGDARTVVDFNTRSVVLVRSGYELRFPNVKDKDKQSLEKIVRTLSPGSSVLTISLDRVLAYLEPAAQPTQRRVEVGIDPPKILYSRKPAILVMFKAVARPPRERTTRPRSPIRAR